MKKILVIGATGTLGKTVTEILSGKYEIITAARKNADVQVDIADVDSIKSMYTQTGKIDGVIVTAGAGYWGPFLSTKETDFYTGIKSKLMGQINIVMEGLNTVNDNGFFTLTSGIIAEKYIQNGVGLSVANGGLNSFVINAAPDMPRNIRLNIVAPSVVEDSVAAYGRFEGWEPVPMKDVAEAYLQTVTGNINGQIIRVYGEKA